MAQSLDPLVQDAHDLYCTLIGFEIFSFEEIRATKTSEEDLCGGRKIYFNENDVMGHIVLKQTLKGREVPRVELGSHKDEQGYVRVHASGRVPHECTIRVDRRGIAYREYRGDSYSACMRVLAQIARIPRKERIVE